MLQVMLDMEYTLQWEDKRLFTHPCYGALPSMMSMDHEAAKSDNARYDKSKIVNQFWNIKLDADGLSPGFDVFDEAATIQLDASTNWTMGIGPFAGHPNASTTCDNCVTRKAAVEVQVSQSTFDFFYYPFDTQVLRVTFQVEGSYIFTCDSTTAIEAMEGIGIGESIESLESALLPFTGEWTLANGRVRSVQMTHNLNADGTPQYDTCSLELIIGRSWTVFVVKSMFTTIVVVIGAVYTALFLHPEEHLGDRAGVLFIGFLILVTNMQMDLSIGIVTSLMWIDMFNLIQCLMVFVALGDHLPAQTLTLTLKATLTLSPES